MREQHPRIDPRAVLKEDAPNAARASYERAQRPMS